MSLSGKMRVNKKWMPVAVILPFLVAVLFVYMYQQDARIMAFVNEIKGESAHPERGTKYFTGRKDGDGSVKTESDNQLKDTVQSESEVFFYKKQLPEKHQVVFEKVHKAASSTFQTILLRFAMSRNINVILMKSTQHLNEFGTYIVPSKLVKLPRGDHFDILCNHIIFDENSISPYFSNSTTYITIVREPFHQFRSAFVYYSQVFKMKMNMDTIKKDPFDPIRYFLRHQEEFASTSPRQSFLNNRMSIDMGFPEANFTLAKQNTTQIKDFINYVHKRFDLVLISELFDESLVLVRRYMNWRMKDILYFQNNVIGSRIKNDFNKGNWTTRNNFTQEDLNLFRKWATIDIELYNSSLKVFKEKIKQEERFDEEVKAFKNIRASVGEFCTKAIKDKKLSGLYVVEENEWTERFEINLRECKIMNMEIGDLVSFTRKVQSEKLNPFL